MSDLPRTLHFYPVDPTCLHNVRRRQSTFRGLEISRRIGGLPGRDPGSHGSPCSLARRGMQACRLD